MIPKTNNRILYSRDIERRTEEYFSRLPSVSRGVKLVDRYIPPKIDKNNYQDEHLEEDPEEDRR